MSTRQFTTRLPIVDLRPKRRSAVRRGAVACLMMWVLLLSLLMAAWVWNWNYLVLVNRSTQQRADILALAAAPALLDEDILRDFPTTPTPDQTDDFVEAVAACELYRDRNNQTGSPSLRLEPSDVHLTSGYVSDVTGQSGPFRFEDARPLPDPTVVPPTPGTQHNTLYVECRRSATDGHPVRYLLNIGGRERTADVLGSSSATLDNLVIGFRPTATANSPVMPIAILADAWNTERPAGPDNHPSVAPGGNGIRELQLRLARSATNATDANAVLTFYDGSIDVSQLTGQIIAGLCAGDLPPSGRLGPVTATATLSAPAIQWVNPVSYPSLNGDLADALNAVAISTTPTRVFPVYDSFTDTPPLDDGRGVSQLIGFVAATVYGATVDTANNRLTATIEPCFIVNHTTWTASPNHPSQPSRNIYVHKLLVSH